MLNTGIKEHREICKKRYKCAIYFSVLLNFVAFISVMLLVKLPMNVFQPFFSSGDQVTKLNTRRKETLLDLLSTVFVIAPITVTVFINGLFLAYKYFRPQPIVSKHFGPQPSSSRNRLAVFLQKVLRTIVTAVTGFLFSRIFLWMIPEQNNAGFMTDVLGIYAALHFLYHNSDTNLVFPLANEPFYLRVKHALIQIVSKHFFKTIVRSLVAWVVIVTTVACLNFDLSYLRQLIGIRILWFVWLQYAYVSTSLAIIREIFNMVMTTPRQFTTEEPGRLMDSGSLSRDFTSLQYAITEVNVPLIQLLAAYDFYNLTQDGNVQRRKVGIFEQFRFYDFDLFKDRYHSVMKEFRNELNELLIDETKLVVNPIKYLDKRVMQPLVSPRKPYTDLNETLGIRNLLASPAGLDQRQYYLQEQQQQQPKANVLINQYLESFLKTVMTRISNFISSKVSLEQENKSQKVNTFFARKAQMMIWLVQASSSLAVQSLVEDNRGLIKPCLSEIFKELVEVHEVVERVNTMNLAIKKVDRNYVALRSATRMALFKIRKNFEPYFDDMIISPDVADYIQANAY